MNLSKVGIWTALFDFAPVDVVRRAAAELEQLGYRTIWVGENIGRDPFTQSGLLLDATREVTVATGVANIWARDPLATLAGQLTLAEAHPGRFVLGLGTSHARLVEGERGHPRFDRPFEKMADYLDAMDKLTGRYRAVRPTEAPLILAALGPRMLSLAAERSDGAHTYLVPPEHTQQARDRLGPDKLLAVEQAVVLQADASTARAIGRRHVRRYLPLPNYTNNLRRLGFDDDDLTDDGSDRLIDALVARGDPEDIHRRVEDHWSAGADHVCIQALPSEPRELPTGQWKELAPMLCQG